LIYGSTPSEWVLTVQALPAFLSDKHEIDPAQRTISKHMPIY